MASSLYGSTGSGGLKGTGYKQISLPNKSPQQMDLFNMGAGGLQGFPDVLKNLMKMAQGGSEESWGQLEAPALRQFGELQGQIASRFSGMGMGNRRSSGFQNALGGAGADLTERLQAQRMGLQNQAQRQLMGLYENLMGQDLNTNYLVPKKTPWWQSALAGLTGAGSQALGTFGGLGLGNWAGL